MGLESDQLGSLLSRPFSWDTDEPIGEFLPSILWFRWRGVAGKGFQSLKAFKTWHSAKLMAILLEANSPIRRRKYLVDCYLKKAKELNQSQAESSLADTAGAAAGDSVRSSARSSADEPLGPMLWLAGSSLAANRIREQLAYSRVANAKPNEGRVEEGSEGWQAQALAILQPGVRTLRQAAETVASMSNETWHPLSKVQQRWLIGKIAEEGKHRGSLGPLQELAASRGLVDLLTTRFDQIRELGLSVEAAGNHLRRSEGRVGGAMSRLYEAYCDRLNNASLFDKAARFELACREVSAWKTGLELLIVETFVPTSPIEKRFLSELLKQGKECVLSVAGRPDQPGTDAASAAGLTSAQAKAWKSFFGQHETLRATRPTETEDGDEKLSKPNALPFLSKHLFLEAKEQEVVSEDIQAVEVLATPSATEELRQVAQRIKKLIVEKNTKPDEIVVATNQLARHAKAIGSTLADYGLPIEVESYERLQESAWISVARQLLEVANSDWQQEPLLALVSRHELKAIRADERHDAEKLIRELGLPNGSRYLILQTESLASRAKDAYAPRNASIAKKALGALMTLSDVMDLLPEKATPLAWFDSIVRAVEQLGYSSSVTGEADRAFSQLSEEAINRDRLARETLEMAFLDLEVLARWRSKNPPQLSLRDIAKLLTDWSERLSLPLKSSSQPKIQVVAAETALGLMPKHLFLVRLEESSFASISSSEPLVENGEPLSTQGEASLNSVNSVERLLFQQLVALPTHSLTFSYSALDEKAVTLHPSPYLTEVERLFPVGALRRTSHRLGELDLKAVPYSLREQRLLAVGNLMEGKAAPLAELFDQQETHQTASLQGSLNVVSERWRGDSYGQAEGVCSSDQVVSLLNKKFGPQHLWSASQLETYANCPFKFFAKYLLDANPLGDSQFEVDYRRRGTLLHDAMVELHSNLSKKLGKGDRVTDFSSEELSDLFREAVESVASRRTLPQHEAGLGEIEQQQTLAWADIYPQQLASFDEKWSALDDPLKPQYYEARFGPMHRDPDEEVEDLVSTDEAYPFLLPSGETLLLTGKIDRIDVGEIAGQTVFGIVDYKTGSNNESKQEEIVSGKKIQLALYAMAAEELFFDSENAVPIAAGYWDIKSKGFLGAGKIELAKLDEKGATLSSDWAETIEAVRGRVESIVKSVRHGEFPMYNTDEDCNRYCDYHTICRVNQARNRDKVWPPPPEKTDSKPTLDSKKGSP